ncbi:MAG: Tex-like N-terminal domain-containing protein, partial [Clostridiaceae bacterium]
MITIQDKLAKEFNIRLNQVESFVELLDGGNTVPFIARYRKEATGGLDDEVLRNLFERLTYLRNLEDRKKDVIRLIEEQGKLTEELKNSVLKCEILSEVEDVYRPYKVKKRTRATIALEKGLKPLADTILEGNFQGNILEYAKGYVDEEKKVLNEEDALKGAMDIISEVIADEAEYRKWLRTYIRREGFVETKGQDKENTTFEMYYDYREMVKSIPAHRILAINRGEKEKILNVKITVDNDKVISYLKVKVLKDNKETDPYIEKSVE